MWSDVGVVDVFLILQGTHCRVRVGTSQEVLRLLLHHFHRPSDRVHLFLCSGMKDVETQGVPLNLYWWGTMITCMIGMTLLGRRVGSASPLAEKVSSRRELKEILVEDIVDTV